ncbi:MAG: siderophore-interacting protein [Micrococcaceae bacterium]
MTESAPSSPAPTRRKKPQAVMEIVATERINAHFQRLTFGGPGFADFQNNASTDKYIKLLLPPDPSLGLTPPFDLDALRAELPKEQLPVRRTYTVRSVDEQAGTLTVDFVLHGDDGVAGPWAASVQVGDLVQFGGPGGKYYPAPETDWHLLAGDEAALPAIAAALEAMDDDAVGVTHLEVATAEDEWDLVAPAGVEVCWHHRGGSFTPENSQLEQAVRDTPWRDGVVQTFIHGEREVMKALRKYFTDERGIERAQLSLSAYWAYGRAEDAFQAEKSTPIGQIYDEQGLQY